MQTFATPDYAPCPIRDADTGQVLVAGCFRARTGRARRRGLLGRDSLPGGRGLLLGEGVVHMAGMRFALDLVFLDRRRRVIKVAENVRPGLRLRGSVRARWTLEMAAGGAQQAGLRAGRRLDFDA